MKGLIAFLMMVVVAGCTHAPSNAGVPPVERSEAEVPTLEMELPHEVFRLSNGLTVVLQPDASMPQVGVEVWIRGGSREEEPWQHGFAHLYEHSVPSSGRFFGNPENRAQLLASRRGSGAGTQPDFLRFYTTATPAGLEALLGSHADRLESDLSRFTDESVLREQDIVISELRRSVAIEWDSDVLEHLSRGTFGASHPYGHPIGGTERGVRATTAAQMREWHRRFAGASNATVFIVGNFDPARARELVRHHFESIPPGPRLGKTMIDMPVVRPRRDVIEKAIPQGHVFIQWPVPGWGTADADHLTLVARILTDRLNAAEERATVEAWELAGVFQLRGLIAESATATESRLRREVERLLADGPTAAEVARARAVLQTELIRALQQPVWRGSRADVLGFGLLFHGNSEHYRTQLSRFDSATPDQLHAAGRRWLAEPGYTLHVLPAAGLSAAPPIDRGSAIQTIDAPPASFPPIAAVTIAGFPALTVVREALPLVQLTFVFDGSGPVREVAVESLEKVVSPALAELGAEIATSHDSDVSLLSLSLLSNHSRAALELVRGALRGEMPEDSFTTARRLVQRRSAARSGSPMQQRYRAVECLIGGECVEPSIDTVSHEAVQQFLRSDPLLIASGDIEGLAAVPAETSARAARAPARRLTPPSGERFVIVDYPSATQVHILLAQLLADTVASDPLPARLVVSQALRQRLMSNLRQEKGWSYEIYPFGIELRGGAAIAQYNIPVQTERTADAIVEVRGEIRRLQEVAVTPGFLNVIRGYLEARLTAGLMSLEELNRQIVEVVRNDLPPDYYSLAIQRLARFNEEEVLQIARELFDEERLIWVLAGDRSAIERELAKLGISQVEVFGSAN